MKKSIIVMMAIFAVSLAAFAFSPAAVSAQTEAEISEPPESQGCVKATGIVTVNILPLPEICGDGVCTKSEACFSCSVDCCLNNPQQNLAGLMTGGTTTSASGMLLAGLMTAFLLAINFKAVLKKDTA